MSVRAYRIKTINWEKEPTFNLWHDREIMDWLISNTDFANGLDEGGAGGRAEVHVNDLRRMLDEIDLDENMEEKIMQDIKRTEEAGDEYVQYECF